MMFGRILPNSLGSSLLVAMLVSVLINSIAAWPTQASTVTELMAEPTVQVAADLAQPTIEERVCHASRTWAEANGMTTPAPVVQQQLATLERICRASLNWADYVEMTPRGTS